MSKMTRTGVAPAWQRGWPFRGTHPADAHSVCALAPGKEARPRSRFASSFRLRSSCWGEGVSFYLSLFIYSFIYLKGGYLSKSTEAKEEVEGLVLKVIRCGAGLSETDAGGGEGDRRGAKARVKNQAPACSHGTLTQARTEHHTTSHRTTTSRLLSRCRSNSWACGAFLVTFLVACHTCLRPTILRITTPSLRPYAPNVGLSLLATGDPPPP
jgi:hypothetical protein